MKDVKDNHENDCCRDAINRVSTNMEPNTINHGGVTGDHNPMLHDNLSKILRWYKGSTAFESRKINPDFAWQARFYEHIVRDDESHHKISEYIINNPLKWTEDDYYEE